LKIEYLWKSLRSGILLIGLSKIDLPKAYLQFSIFNIQSSILRGFGFGIMQKQLIKILESELIEASAPCRIDMGGTLDIATFYYPLHHQSPCTFNIALGLRTRVRLQPYTKGMIRISSSGFKAAQFKADAAPFDHPLGLMFATAAYFNAGGIHIEIESQSPPRSALGGSSVAAVALVAAFSKLMTPGKSDVGPNRRATALLAYQIEQSVAGVPCGIQDQLAAAYGGVNAWYLQAKPMGPTFKKRCIVGKNFHHDLERHLLIAYCGKPHVSKDINGRWIRQFLSGRYRDLWLEIIACTRRFVAALAEKNYNQAAVEMNRETAIRRTLTPDVLDNIGEKLVAGARQNDCGARFTGAGGGGCLWALGEIENIDRLRPLWEKTLFARDEARLLEVKIDSKGLLVE
jgi:D-glycero-alpha-D-manno-heptose-7-phosphate kinase